MTVKATDAEGKPAARKLLLKILEKTNVDGKIGERLVTQYDIVTDEKEGVARQTLTL